MMNRWVLCLCVEEPEEELSVEELEERAKSGDAKAQSRVSITHSPPQRDHQSKHE